MKDFVEHLRAKPENTRKTIALSAAGAVTAVVAIGWVIALVSSGGLAVAPKIGSDSAAAFKEGEQRYSDLAGAASAFYGNTSGEGGITVVEEDRSSTLDRTEATPAEETVIHF